MKKTFENILGKEENAGFRLELLTYTNTYTEQNYYRKFVIITLLLF